MSYEVHVKQLSAQPVATRRTHTPLSEIGHVMQSTIASIAGAVHPEGAARGAPFAIYHNEPFRPEDVDVEVGLPLAGAASLDGDGVQRRELPAGPVAYVMHVGPYADIGAAYQALYGWIQRHGYKASGPPREIYVVGPGAGVGPSEYRTEIDVPIG